MKTKIIGIYFLLLFVINISGLDLLPSHKYKRMVDQKACRYTPTTVSGTKAPTGRLCKGQLLLNEQFTDFDRKLWQHEITLGGGGVSNSIFN